MTDKMKYDEILSLTNLRGKFERSDEDERIKYKKAELYVTEKVHGENWRLGIVDGKKVIGGRKHLFYWDEIAEEFIHEHTHKPHPNWTKINDKGQDEIFSVLDALEKGGYNNVIFFGELYGNGLQSGFSFNHEGYAMVYYEITSAGKYIDQQEAFVWFEIFGVKQVPYIGRMTLDDFLNVDVEELHSSIAKESYIEGIVGIPVGGTFDWDFPARFAIKKKTKKYAESKSSKSKGPKKVKRKSSFAIHMTEERLNHVLADLKEDGHVFSHEKDFRFLVVESLIKNIQNEENEGAEFSKEDKKSLGREGHKLFSQYAVL